MLRLARGSGEVTDRAVVVACAVIFALAAAGGLETVSAAVVHGAAANFATAAPLPPKAHLQLAEHRSDVYGPEQRAQELYLDGMEKLDAGHAEWARKTFDSLLARFPDSAAADLARRQLGALDHGHDHGHGLDASGVAPVKGRAQAPASDPTPVISRSAAWRQELRRNAAIQAKLRTEAGDRVFFSAGSAELGTRARMALAAQAQWLKQWHEFEAAIAGHADEPGTEEENLRLSRDRAEAVRRRLVAEGVAAARLAVVALGRTDPIAPCADPDCAAQNRRAVTLVFASGTRERLGLNNERAADLVPPAPPGAPSLAPSLAPLAPASADAQPAASERIGVAR